MIKKIKQFYIALPQKEELIHPESVKKKYNRFSFAALFQLSGSIQFRVIFY